MTMVVKPTIPQATAVIPKPPPNPATTAPLGLLTALIAYWPGNEASGDLIDAHTNGLDLTDKNTVTNNTGKVYATARQYTAANQERHSIADNALLSAGDVDLTLAAWVYLTDNTNTRGIMTKFGGDNPVREYALQYNVSVDRFRFIVTGDNHITWIDADNLGSPSLNTWYFVVGWHDATLDTISIQINNGTTESADHEWGINDTETYFQIGYYENTALSHWDGRIGPSALWKSAAGGGGVLTAAQRTALYNNSNGLTYAALT